MKRPMEIFTLHVKVRGSYWVLLGVEVHRIIKVEKDL